MSKTRTDLNLEFPEYQKNSPIETYSENLAKKLFKGNLRDNGASYFDAHLKPVAENSRNVATDKFKNIVYSAGILHDFPEDLPKLTKNKNLAPVKVMKYLNFLFKEELNSRRIINPIGLLSKPGIYCLEDSIDNGLKFRNQKFPKELFNNFNDYSLLLKNKPENLQLRELFYCLRKPLRIIHPTSRVLTRIPTLDDRIIAALISIFDIENNFQLEDVNKGRTIAKATQMVYLGSLYSNFIKKNDKSNIVEFNDLEKKIKNYQSKAMCFLSENESPIIHINSLNKYKL
jgi:hypothetical protein